MQGLPSDALAVLHSLASLIVPSDEQGPGASDAQVVSELDRVLTEDRVRQVRYLAGLRAFDDYAQRECGARFAALPLNQQMQLVIGIEQVRDRIYAEAGSLSERLRRRLSYWYYTGWHEFLPLIEFWQLLRTDVLTVFYSNEVVWKWLGYSGPPFPLGYYPRVPGT